MHPVSLAQDIPDDAQRQLALMAPAGVQCVAFTPGGGWVIAGRAGAAHAGYAARGIPDACFVQLGAFVRAGHAIRAIAFPPSPAGAWAIVSDRAHAASGISADAFAALGDARAHGAQPVCLAFAPHGDGWVLLSERSSERLIDRPSDDRQPGQVLRGRAVEPHCWQALGNLAQGLQPPRQVAFAPGGGWVIATPDGVVADGVPEACRDHLAQVAQRHVVDRIAFAPGGGWALGSTTLIVAQPVDPLREFEARFRLVNGRWCSFAQRMAAHRVTGASIALRLGGAPAWTTEHGVLSATGLRCRVDVEAAAQPVSFSLCTEGSGAAALADEIAEALLRVHGDGVAASETVTR